MNTNETIRVILCNAYTINLPRDLFSGTKIIHVSKTLYHDMDVKKAEMNSNNFVKKYIC